MKGKIYSEILSEVTPEIESKVEQKTNQILAIVNDKTKNMKILKQIFKVLLFSLICAGAVLYGLYLAGILGIMQAKNYQTRQGRISYGILTVINFAAWAVTLILIIKK